MLLTLRTHGGFPGAGVGPAKEAEARARRVARRHGSKTAHGILNQGQQTLIDQCRGCRLGDPLMHHRTVRTMRSIDPVGQIF